jgi:hypothetical protein
MKTVGNMLAWVMWIIVAGLLVALLAVGTGACSEPTTQYKGKPVTEAELAEVVARDIDAAGAAAKKAAQAAAAAEAAEVRRLEREAAERTRAFERQLARLVAEQQFEVEDLRDMFAQEFSAITDAIEAAGTARALAMKAAADELDRFTANAEAARATAQADIDKQWNVRETIGSILAPAADAGAAFVPGLSAVIGAVGGGTGLVGLLGLSRANRKRLSAQEATRAALAAIDMLPPDMRAAAEKALAAVADRQDMAVIGRIQREDDLTVMPAMQKVA